MLISMLRSSRLVHGFQNATGMNDYNLWNRTFASSAQSFMNSEKYKVALIGRTNVGKSTLFNRLTKSRKAIVHDVPGTTRDRREAKGRLAGMEFSVIDTGGLADTPSGSIEEGMLFQSGKAVQDANMILFMIDGREGVTVIDKHFANWLRRENPKVPVHLIANKLEGFPSRWENAVYDYHELGLGDSIPLSSEHGEGIPFLIDLLIPEIDAFEKHQQQQQENNPVGIEEGDMNILLKNGATSDPEPEAGENSTKEAIKLAIVGRPNVGKSSILNQLVRDERFLTGSMPGVTRDAVEVEWEFSNRIVKLVDTAGFRRVAKRDQDNDIENLSVRDAERAIASAQMVAVVVDLQEPKLIKMDLAIAQKAIDEGRAVVIIANKSDQIAEAQAGKKRIEDELHDSLAQIRGVPVIPTSALTGDGIRRIMPSVLETYEKWNARISTGKLNRWLKAIHRHHPAPRSKGKQLKVKYITQVSTRPPCFSMFVNNADLASETYKRFMLHQIREEFNMVGIPVRLNIRCSENPYADRPNKKQLSKQHMTKRTILNKQHHHQKKKQTSGKPY